MEKGKVRRTPQSCYVHDHDGIFRYLFISEVGSSHDFERELPTKNRGRKNEHLFDNDFPKPVAG